MNVTKLFNRFISQNFRGLSAHTLTQFLLMEGYSKDYADSMVYVELYHMFTKTATEEEAQTFDTVRYMVSTCAWL